MKTNYFLILFILISGTSTAQFEYDSRFYDEILKDNFYDTKTSKQVGLTGNVKNIKVYIQSVNKNKKNVIERDLEFGWFYEFDKMGRAQSSFIYDTIEQIKMNKSVIDKKQKNYVFYNKNGLIEKELREAGTITDFYDINGNIVEEVVVLSRNTIKFELDTSYQLTKYIYDRSNKILEITAYWQTAKRDSLSVKSHTKNKLDARGNILESEVKSGPRNLKTYFEYDERDNPVSISNSTQDITIAYDEDNKMETLEILSESNKEIIAYKNNRISSKRYTYKNLKDKNLTYSYKDDKVGNWIFCSIEVVIYNKQNQSIPLKYEIIREIEYYK